MSTDCLFCKIAGGIIPTQPLYQDDEFFAFPDIAPQAPTHVLVIPKAHYENAAAVTDSALLGRLLHRATQLAQTLGVDQTGYRLVLNTGTEAGQTIFHVHVHLLGGRPMLWPPG